MQPQQVFRAYETAGHIEQANFCLACGTKLTELLDGDRTRRACPSCGYIRYRNPAPAVSVLIVEHDRFVLCRRHSRAFEGDKWCLPCGYVEYEESYLSAALREVREETGLDAEISGIISVCSNLLAPDVHTVVTVLLARPAGGELCAGDDVALARWFTRGEALPELAFEADRHIIERYFATRLAGAPVDPRYARQA